MISINNMSAQKIIQPQEYTREVEVEPEINELRGCDTYILGDAMKRTY